MQLSFNVFDKNIYIEDFVLNNDHDKFKDAYNS